MSVPTRFRVPLFAALLPLLLATASADAANVMYLPGYGTESTLMGGADVAVSRDSFATNNNPAGLSQISGKAMDMNLSVYHAEGATHSDTYGSYRRDAKNQDGGYGNFGYAQHIENTPFTVGLGLVVQGGVGWIYKNMTTSPALGSNRDEATSLFSVIKLAPAASWQVNDSMSIGAALGLNYMAGSQTLFPNTSVDGVFAGINFKDGSGMSLSGKLGLQYRPAEDVVIGVTYGSKSKVDMKGGTLRVNYSNYAGINQIVRYDDAKIEGFGLPQEIAIGIAFRPIKPLLVSVQEKWYDWSEALKSTTLMAKNPRITNPLVPKELAFTSQVGALDQHVYAIGASYAYSDKLTLMGGVNYARRAIPEQNLAPTFQVIQQVSYTAGARYQFSDEWFADIGLERLPQQMVTYNNPATPFGPSVANHSGRVLHMQLSRRWN